MAKIRDYKELVVWQKSIDLVVDIYALLKSFPKDEVFSLVSQIKRAAVSIPSNIAEGTERTSTKEFIHFLDIALGSAAELETQIIISYKIGYLKDISIIFNKITVLRKMINGLKNKLKNKI